jgi:hypothetical protein
VSNGIVIGISHDNRDCAGRLLRSTGRGDTDGNYAIHIEADELSRKIREASHPAPRKSPFNDQVLPFDVSHVAQTISKCLFAALDAGAVRYVTDTVNTSRLLARSGERRSQQGEHEA